MNTDLHKMMLDGAFGMGASVGIGFLFLVAWTLFWKGLALWHAGRKGHAGWFVACLLINLGGIIDIIYLFLVLKLRIKDLFSK